MEKIRESDPMLLYATVVDLNLYIPIHHQELSQDWTGVAERDAFYNRAKRFLYDRGLTTEGARIGLGSAAATVPDRATREVFIQAGCEMHQRAGSDEIFSLKLRVRDLDDVIVAVQVPLFVKNHRYGAVSCGWRMDKQ
jgi:methyl-accepting chemotaxis protein